MPALRPAARLLYAAGGFGSSVLQQTVLLWVFFFYAPPPGQPLVTRVAPAVVGLAMAAGRIVDAVADPLVAHWSDGLRTPWGRRRPFILVASPLLALCFVLLWRPPVEGPASANALYLTIILGLFFFLYTMVLNPYTALLPEITSGGEGRVATSSLMAAFNLAGIGTAFVASSWLSTRFGFGRMGLILAPVALAALLLPAFAVRETIPTTPAQPFRRVLRSVFSDPRFRIYALGIATMWFGLSMVNLSLALMVTGLMRLPASAVGRVLALSLGATVLTLPAATLAVRRFGPRRILLTAMLALAAELFLAAGLGRWPMPVSPVTQGYILLMLAGPAIAALFILPNALLAEIAEDHARGGGGRVEGMFFAFQGLIFNGTTSLAAAALGGLLGWLGQAPPAATGLRAALLLAALATGVGALIFLRYPATEPPRASPRV